jgi:hypothetical protein
MGIRFDCPNGHKLNVKSFLAGKKGICPQCGAKFRIPESSTDAADDGSEADMGPPPDEGRPVVKAMDGAPPMEPKPGAKTTVAQQPKAATAPVTPVAAVPTGVPVGTVTPVTVTPVVPVGTAAQPATLADAVRAAAATAATAPAPAPAAAANDPIAEAPTAIWYVRPPSGGQYGPARGDLLRQWVNEGRVTPQSLVWREGWPDWKVASDVFPSLGGAAPEVSGGIPVDVGGSTRKTARYIAKKKSSNTVAIGGIVILVLVVIGLVVALAFVLSNTKTSATAARATAAVEVAAVPR